MEWQDEGIVLGTRKHGETSAILEVMTRGRGRHLGLVRGGRSRKLQPVLQPGNRLQLHWHARLDEHLGTFQVEPLQLNAARLFDSATAVYGLQTLAAHLRLLPERDPHTGIFDAFAAIVECLEETSGAAELVVRFEMLLLDELGFGLDLTECAATGARQELVYVSPKSGRAVSREAGAPWQERLLPLPSFLLARRAAMPEIPDIENAFRLTGHFFERHVYGPRGLREPEARAGFIAAWRKAAGKALAPPPAA